MNTKNVIGIAVLVIVALFAIQMIQQDRVDAQQTSSNRTQTGQAVEYARLVVEDEDSVTWLIGGVENVRTESVRATFRRLGGQGRGTFADLLDQIGSQNWSLIEKDGNIWIFSRPAT